jgi:hypothetical protein
MQASKRLPVLRPQTLIALCLVLALVAIGGSWLWLSGAAQRARQAEIATLGSQVMPFDLERTTHIFTDQPDGGLQQVIADDPSDATQITLIREHLQKEAAAFARGDFADPASIHGGTMPGLAELRTSAGQIDVAYSELPNGAQIRYTTGDPALVGALHAWFQAQLSDHGGHAMDHSGS